MIALKKILVATDFSEPSEAALAYGRELARSFDAALTVVHVVGDTMARAYGIDGGVVLTEPDMQLEFEASALAQVNALLVEEDRTQLKAGAQILTSNAPALAIVT